MNERGSMLLDALLGFAIVTICSLIIIPIFMYMQMNVQRHLLNYHASEVLVNAAKEVFHENNTSGSYWIDDDQFEWHYEQQRLCVLYFYRNEEVKQCASSDKVVSH